MKGLDISRRYYSEYGIQMLENEFGDLIKYLAIGYVGSGSEHYGFDDVISQDHDFEPGFCIFLPGEDVVSRRDAFLLEKAYSKLPKEFLGFKRQILAPVGGNRNGIIRTADFYLKSVGSPDGELSVDAWLHIPDYALAEATNGEIYMDEYGEFSYIRDKLLSMPNDIKAKRIAGNMLIMGQSGQYNYERCIKHGEFDAAQLAINQFVQSSIKVLFYLSDKYMPYYKWSFRALRQINNMSDVAENLSYLLKGNNEDKAIFENKNKKIESISKFIVDLLNRKGLSNSNSVNLEEQAYSINNTIKDSYIRNMHVLETVE